MPEPLPETKATHMTAMPADEATTGSLHHLSIEAEEAGTEPKASSASSEVLPQTTTGVPVRLSGKRLAVVEIWLAKDCLIGI